MTTRRAMLGSVAAGALVARGVQARVRPTAGVVASFSILADMVREVAPADVEVSALVGPDTDAHVFEATSAHARRLAEAELVVVNGLGFEGWIDRLVAVSGYRGRVVVATRGIVPQRNGLHGVDPHAWQSLTLARGYVATITDALCTTWPARATLILARSDAYLAKLKRLDQSARAAFDAVPPHERRVITSHAAFGYLGAAYGIAFLAPQGWSPLGEPSAGAVARLVRQIREERVRAIFLESLSDPRVMQRIAGETGVRIGGTLYADALSAPGGPAGTYLGLFAHNVRMLTGALAG